MSDTEDRRRVGAAAHPCAGDCAVIIFAKAPVAGYAKTRLESVLGPSGAAQLAERLLEETARVAAAAGVGALELCCAPDTTHPVFASLAARFGAALTSQGDGHLGRRMAAAFERALARHAAVLVIGTDAPGLDAAYLREAAGWLRCRDAVLGPARDGGYTLIGLRRPAPALFEGIDWSTAAVLAQTRRRLHQAGLRHRELAELSDIDEPADLAGLPAPLQALAAHCAERWAAQRVGLGTLPASSRPQD